MTVVAYCLCLCHTPSTANQSPTSTASTPGVTPAPPGVDSRRHYGATRRRSRAISIFRHNPLASTASISGVYSIDPGFTPAPPGVNPRRHYGATRRRSGAISIFRRHPLAPTASISGVYSVSVPPPPYINPGVISASILTARVKYPGFTLTMESRNLGSNILDFGVVASGTKGLG